eukprot:Rmarinus@m.9084
MSKGAETVKVVVRCRPPNAKEIAENRGSCVDVDVPLGQIRLTSSSDDHSSKAFTYDNVYDKDSLQIDVYNQAARPIVDSVIEGYNGTVFAYGQTGCGKTFSMEGVKDDPDLQGIIPRSFSHIFAKISKTTDKKFLVRASYLEIYNEEIRDLLGKDPKEKRELKEHPEKGVFVKDLTTLVVNSPEDMYQVLLTGGKNRSVGETLMNRDSSRSHSVFSITIETSEDVAGDARIKAGKLNLVDLAGSERQSKTGAEGDRFLEATKINLSLTALGNVISALCADKKGKGHHVPYRDSKLTRLLQDSLGGNTKTMMLAAISPADYNFDETLSTLRYANRAKNIKNKPKINEDPKDAMLREFQMEIQRLKSLLQNQGIDSGSQNAAAIAEVAASAGASEGAQAAVMQLSDQLATEREEKEALARKIQAMQSQVLAGGEIAEVVDVSETEKIRDYYEEKSKREIEEKEEELLYLDEEFTSLKDELVHKKKILKKLRQRYQQAKLEIEDLQDEFEYEREDFLDTIRAQEKDLRLYRTICETYLGHDKLAKIEKKSRYDADQECWIVPKREAAASSRPRSSSKGRREKRGSFDRTGTPNAAETPPGTPPHDGQNNANALSRQPPPPPPPEEKKKPVPPPPQERKASVGDPAGDDYYDDVFDDDNGRYEAAQSDVAAAGRPPRDASHTHGRVADPNASPVPPQPSAAAEPGMGLKEKNSMLEQAKFQALSRMPNVMISQLYLKDTGVGAVGPLAGNNQSYQRRAPHRLDQHQQESVESRTLVQFQQDAKIQHQIAADAKRWGEISTKQKSSSPNDEIMFVKSLVAS